ncbi:hypothetical protein RJT34_03441 [Clitoria ternatea]|uniref:Cupin type-1 domain-containing protein n=1 Tax=Clitoria ternatea TaxID=43366 RepID=A0AAN9KK86_CLITE
MGTPYPNPITPSETRIGWIGIGVMGHPMASRLISNGYKLTFYARNPSHPNSLSLQSQGASLANSPSQLAHQTDVVFTILGHPSDVRSVYLHQTGLVSSLRPNSVTVDHTSSHPDLAREIFAAAREKDAWSVDAPVSGGDIGARDGKLAILTAGEASVVEWLNPLFIILGKATYMGPAGYGQSCKIANQITIGANLIGLSESLVFAKRAGLDLEKFLEAIKNGSAGSKALELFGERMIQRDFRPGGFAEYQVKDLGMGVDIVEGVDDDKVVVLPGASLCKQLFSSMVANGDGKLGGQGVISVIERINGREIKEMELDLSPKTAKAMFEGDGGSYYVWSSSEMPILAKTNVSAARFLLHPHGFALPHYADSSKLGYVVQGIDGIVGMVLPTTGKEVVLKLKQGDIIPVPLGAVSWWFNNGDSDLTIVFLGETSKALIPGEFTYFFLTGAIGLIGGFSPELTSKVYDLNQDEVNKLTKSQTGALIIKLDKSHSIPKPQLDITKDLVYNIDDALLKHDVKNAGLVKTLTEKDFPFIGDVGLSVVRVKLEPGASKAPSFPPNSEVQLIYIAGGSGKVEIVGMNGKPALDTQVKAGHLFVVPQFFVVAEIAGDEGMESYSTTTQPLVEELAGKASVWGAISPAVQQVALNVDSEFQKLFISKIKESANVINPSY